MRPFYPTIEKRNRTEFVKSGEMFDVIFDLARSGQGYVAIERSSLITRKLKRANQISEAFLRMMDLANILFDSGQPVLSGTAASRAIRFLPEEPSDVDPNFQSIISSYLHRVGPEAYSQDLCIFLDVSVKLLGDHDFFIREKHALIADQSDSYHPAQIAYSRLITGRIEKHLAVDAHLSLLVQLLWRWVSTIPDERRAIFTSQFIFARLVFVILASGQTPIASEFGAAALRLLEFADEGGRLKSLPLFLFARLLIGAVMAADKAIFSELWSVYRPLLRKSPEFSQWAMTIQRVYFDPNHETRAMTWANIGPMVNQMLGSLTGFQGNMG
jgi:hypothetical protein